MQQSSERKRPFVSITSLSEAWMGPGYQVPAEVDVKSFVTDQQMDTPDGRVEAKKFVKKVIQESMQHLEVWG